MPDEKKYSDLIKSEATRLGFLECGISKAEPLQKEAENLKKWLQENRHGEMQWMENYFNKRTDPTQLVEGAKSVISVIYNYYPKQLQRDDTYRITKYAYGKDYHFVLKSKLKTLLHFIQENLSGEVRGRVFVDSAPVMDKVWAQKSGLGWIGKHTNLLSRRHGSFFVIGEIITDLPLSYDQPVKDYCGSCTKCLEACPTGSLSLSEPYKIDASKCISYFTIEKKGDLPADMKGKFEDWIFGCDICQDVCPWNLRENPHNEPEFDPHPDLLTLTKPDWEKLTHDHFNEIFRKSAVKRTKYHGLKRNIEFVKDKNEYIPK
jgi:epoxyqueuosine reductase